MTKRTFAWLSRTRYSHLRGKPSALVSVWAALLIGASGACAQDLGAERFTLRGFGTLGATTHDTDGIEFRRSTGQAHGAESGGMDLAIDSIAGVQLDAKLSPTFDLMLQGVSRLQANGDWSPELSLGFLRWAPGDSLTLRAGRIGYDIYLLAESRQVGYSYLTIRPSPEFYGQITNDQFDGADLSYTRRAGHGLVRVRGFGGGGSGEVALADHTHSHTRGKIFGATFDYLYRGWTARIALVRFDYDAGRQMPMLAGALRATGFPQAGAIAGDIDHNAYTSMGMQLGVAYDDGPVLAQLMYGAVESDSIVGPEFDKTYALFGYRFGKWTPFAAFAGSNDRNPVHDAGLPGFPIFAPLNAAVVNIQEASRSTQHTTSVGLRYDLSSHLDFKLQLDFVSVRDSTLVFDYRASPGAPFDMTVVAAAVDFVF